ncbi:hypothetical protein M407DRAFT_28420 [Tulasnella calospora MUT 4182]|uniref:Protein kinase domain-containing protein n=1 Tax=Tulasnella calospora MUT 4182 TaxID=1051891 RepID=A0A0C3KKR6_9AGAM|nr:hypothetical protein M407DRAFT_28420 [Tulasnella calospora MUT 4182]
MISPALRSTQLANAKNRYSRATTPVSAPSGHHSTSETPVKFIRLPTPANEEAPAVDHQLVSELHGHVIFTKPEKFIETFMYFKEPSRLEIDQTLAKDCFTSLQCRQEDPRFNAVVEAMVVEEQTKMDQILSSVSTYSDGQFKGLVTGISREDDLYRPLVTLLTYINSFFSINFSDGPRADGWTPGIDKDWEKARDPGLGELNTDAQPPKPKSFLQRRFVITHKRKGLFSNHIVHGPQLLPDLCLLLQPAIKSTETRKAGLGELFWKNVKVPIEVKLKDRLDTAITCQMARYARAVKLEQFDRNVVFSVLLSKRKCRVFHWDAAGCHTTEIDVHENPTAFIQVVGRFASMSPASMGYDVRFSNAGRVLAGEKTRTVLKVFPGPVEEYFDQYPAGDDAGNAIKVDILVDNPIFEARGLLFSRFTRVWEGREVKDEAQWSTGPLRVVKQNWADARRTNEAFLCDRAKNIPSVAKVLGSQVIEGTANHHKGITADDILGVYQMAKSAAQPTTSDSGTEEVRFEKCEETELLERVLVRMVFDQKGRSIFKVKGCKELLQATKNWVEGLQGLREHGIIHRDISSGNLLLGQDPDSRAFIIDLGLAHFDPEDINTVSGSRKDKERDARDHHHLTGTLPFISHQILEATSSEGQPISHKLYHDLESIFWVLAHLVLREETSPKAKKHLDGLLSSKVDEVCAHKKSLLSDDFEIIPFSGRFKDLAPFLNKFAQACWDYHKRRRATLEPEDVINMIDSALRYLPPFSGEIVRSSAGHSDTKRKRDGDLDETDLPEPASKKHGVDAQ